MPNTRIWMRYGSGTPCKSLPTLYNPYSASATLRWIAQPLSVLRAPHRWYASVSGSEMPSPWHYGRETYLYAHVHPLTV